MGCATVPFNQPRHFASLAAFEGGHMQSGKSGGFTAHGAMLLQTAAIAYEPCGPLASRVETGARFFVVDIRRVSSMSPEFDVLRQLSSRGPDAILDKLIDQL